MSISEWWRSDSSERYWMEATDRRDLGGDLKAPKAGSRGQNVWHYELVSHTSPGDIVFHWHTKMHGVPALVGWSEVIGPLRTEDYLWTPHAGTAAATSSLPQPNWMMPLGGVRLLDTPITIRDIERLREDVLAVRDALEDEHGTPVYFPFNGYGTAHIRAAQAYLTKLPRGLVDLLAERFDLELNATAIVGQPDPLAEREPPDAPTPTSQGYMLDAAKRRAIENWAVSRAVDHYKSLGATDIALLGKPYDIRLQLDGQEVHVEVKGSTGVAEAVLVTINEVVHAQTYPHVHLVVVDSIEWNVGKDAVFTASAGRLRHWDRWDVQDTSLTAKAFSHFLGTGYKTF